MSLINRIAEVVRSYGDQALFTLSSDSDGLLLTLSLEDLQRCETGTASSSLLNQYIHLQMLEEQGESVRIGNGFLIETQHAVRLDENLRSLLQLPSPWPGKFEIEFIGLTFKSDYQLNLLLIEQNGRKERRFETKGPLLKLTENEVYLPSEIQWEAFRIVEEHRLLAIDERDEFRNLTAISALQHIRRLGLPIDLRQFDKIVAEEPDDVAVSISINNRGDLELLPAFRGVAPEDIERQLDKFEKIGSSSFRVNEKILLLDERRLEKIQEILNNRTIPKAEIKRFLKTPSAYLDASLVDFDVGYSLRVQGVSEFVHAYFGDTDESGIDWFASPIEAGAIEAPSEICKRLRTVEDVERFEERLSAAQSTGADCMAFDDAIFDISDAGAVNSALDVAREKLVDNVAADDHPDDATSISGEVAAKITLALDIAKNDTQQDFGAEIAANSRLYSDKIDWSKYKRQPFKYQEAGVRWAVGLSAHTYDQTADDAGKYGGLLADDMGLGKTYMSLVALNEYLAQGTSSLQNTRPVLVVAPLSLLENWKDEVDKTYIDSPFKSIIILQSNADLRKYRIEGRGKDTTQLENNEIDQIRFSLKVGSEFGLNRLDMPERLVITTYQTLRDYQFSLAMIDWSLVVFDEAQNIKNPNALATIAAKALKAQFKLLATGTPVENSLADFWSLMDTAHPGHLGTFQEFRDNYIKPILQSNDEERRDVRIGIGKQLRMDTGSLMLRRIKEDELEGLPKKIIYSGDRNLGSEHYYPILDCKMTERQANAYDQILELVAEQKETKDSGASVLAGLHRLRDASLHPSLVEGGGLRLPASESEARTVIEESGKLSAVMELLLEIKSRDEKVIVFLINKNLQKFLKRAFELIFRRSVAVINGDTKAMASPGGGDTRKSLISAFEAVIGFNVIIMSPIAAGTGLTIVGANNVVHLERHWNPAKEAQATDRVYRIGQLKDVNVYLPVLHHPDQEITSFEQNLARLLGSKSALKDAVITPEEVGPADLSQNLFSEDIDTASTPYVYKPEDLQALSWSQFEAFSVELLGKFYRGSPKLTQEGADDGVDGIVTGECNVLIQAKHTTGDKLASKSACREVFAGKPIYEKALKMSFQKLVVITNASVVSADVRKVAKEYKIELFDYKKLSKVMIQHPITDIDVLRRLDSSRFKIK